MNKDLKAAFDDLAWIRNIIINFQLFYNTEGGLISQLPLNAEQKENVEIMMENIMEIFLSFIAEFDASRFTSLRLREYQKQREKYTAEKDYKRAGFYKTQYNQRLKKTLEHLWKADELSSLALLEQENFRIYLGSLNGGRMEELVRNILARRRQR